MSEEKFTREYAMSKALELMTMHNVLPEDRQAHMIEAQAWLAFAGGLRRAEVKNQAPLDSRNAYSAAADKLALSIDNLAFTLKHAFTSTMSDVTEAIELLGKKVAELAERQDKLLFPGALPLSHPKETQRPPESDDEGQRHEQGQDVS